MAPRDPSGRQRHPEAAELTSGDNLAVPEIPSPASGGPLGSTGPCHPIMAAGRVFKRPEDI